MPDLVCKCVTMIALASSWFEIHQYDDKRAITLANVVEHEWLLRYPWPTQITFDRGYKFIGHKFRHMVGHDYGIKCKPITVQNPQANAIVKQIHQVIANMVQTFDLESNYLDKEDPWKGVLAATMFAVKLTYHTSLKRTSGQLVFGRDMIFNIQHVTSWEFIRQFKQICISRNNKAGNTKHQTHTYKEGDLVLLK